MKKIAVVCSGWHFPYSFYSTIAQQRIPTGWKLDMFCVSHRDPKYSAEEKSNLAIEGSRAFLDTQLYSGIAFREDIEQLGWCYKEYPNTVGDWGCTNQWLGDVSYSDYDLLLFTHDDNLILSTEWFAEVLESEDFDKWEILSNGCGAPKGWLRGSCEFFKPSLLDKLGGKFDLSTVTLDRTGEVYGSGDLGQLSNWNNSVTPLMSFIKNNNIQIHFSSEYYRVSKYCLEGERGFISKTTSSNTHSEDEGLRILKLI